MELLHFMSSFDPYVWFSKVYGKNLIFFFLWSNLKMWGYPQFFALLHFMSSFDPYVWFSKVYGKNLIFFFVVKFENVGISTIFFLNAFKLLKIGRFF